MSAGFKNWRPARLVGARQQGDGTFAGGRVVPLSNAEIADFSLEQFYGNGAKPDDDHDWREGTFTLNGAPYDWYDYVRAKIAGGRLQFDPLREVADMVDSNCADLHDRVDAVDLAVKFGLAARAEPQRLPDNIYGTDGDWESFSSPSRDARLKTAFKELRDAAERFVRMSRAKDPKLQYKGSDLTADLIAVYDRHAQQCSITYTRSDGSAVALPYEELRKRLFALSFDPYQCVERRWGASRADELATCPETTLKAAWYDAEQPLRNQLDRTYDVADGLHARRAENARRRQGRGCPAGRRRARIPRDLPLVGRSKSRSEAKRFRVGAAAPHRSPTRKILRIFRPPHKGEGRCGRACNRRSRPRPCRCRRAGRAARHRRRSPHSNVPRGSRSIAWPWGRCRPASPRYRRASGRRHGSLRPKARRRLRLDGPCSSPPRSCRTRRGSAPPAAACRRRSGRLRPRAR
jgi:hypothetical protein